MKHIGAYKSLTVISVQENKNFFDAPQPKAATGVQVQLAYKLDNGPAS